MPTTFVGLLIFVVLLAPGFVHLLVSERGPFPGRDVSVLRETANVALSSLTFDLIALAVFGLIRTVWPTHTPDVGRLVRELDDYIREDYLFLAWWFIGVLALACAMAIVWAALLTATNRFERLQKRWPFCLLLPEDGVKFVSAWWKLLRQANPDYERRVVCRLEDGSSVEGWLHSLNPDVDETADRELALSAPLTFRDRSGTERTEQFGAVAISARRIIELYVEYEDRPGSDEEPATPDDHVATPLSQNQPPEKSA